MLSGQSQGVTRAKVRKQRPIAAGEKNFRPISYEVLTTRRHIPPHRRLLMQTNFHNHAHKPHNLLQHIRPLFNLDALDVGFAQLAYALEALVEAPLVEDIVVVVYGGYGCGVLGGAAAGRDVGEWGDAGGVEFVADLVADDFEDLWGGGLGYDEENFAVLHLHICCGIGLRVGKVVVMAGRSLVMGAGSRVC